MGGGLSVGWQKDMKPPNTVDMLRERGRDRRYLDLNQVKDREKKDRNNERKKEGQKLKKMLKKKGKSKIRQRKNS